MKIITRYVLREHIGPLAFALTALTSLMLLNFISRQFGELVGKGLPWSVIGEFFMLSIPFTVALTVPMSVLVAVLYAFSRLAAENEVTALKASGVSPWRMVAPAIAGGLLWSLALLAFNDQVLPRANHRLKVLQEDISQTKPTFLLKEQVINTVSEGKLYLKAGKIDRSGESGRMREVVIYDLSNPLRRKTIYATSGRILMVGTDLQLDLYSGQMQEVATDTPGQLDRLFFDHDLIRVKGVTNELKRTKSEQASKGDREMGICEMQDRLGVAEASYRAARAEYDLAQKGGPRPMDFRVALDAGRPVKAGGIGRLYCTVIRDLLKVKEAEAAELPARHAARSPADTTPVASDSTPEVRAQRVPAARGDSARRAGLRADSVRRAALRGAVRGALPLPVAPPAPVPPGAANAPPPRTDSVPVPTHTSTPEIPAAGPGELTPENDSRLAEARLRLDLATRNRNRYDIEIHKKFSLAAACLIFSVLGAPLAVRFPRGGVGLVLGVSLVVFALYYVGLIGGEALANEGKVPPFWAMWGTNVILTLVGVVLLLRMGKDQNTGRGGDWADRLDAVKGWFGRGPRARRRA